MKKIKMRLFAFVLTTSSAFAQDSVNCTFKIQDNSVRCPAIGRCPQKVLRISNHELNIVIHPGEIKKGSIALKEVILFPGTKKQEDNFVSLFESDMRDIKLKTENKIDLVSYESPSKIDYKVRTNSGAIFFDFSTKGYSTSLAFSDYGQQYIMTKKTPVYAYCGKINKEVYEEIDAKKEAINNHLKEKAPAKKGTSKQ